MVDDGADENLVGRRGAQTGAGQNGGFAVSVEARHGAAKLREPRRHAPDQGGGGVDLRFPGCQLGKLHRGHGIPLGEDADGVGTVDSHRRLGVQIDGSGQHSAPLMIGVVAADLRPSGGGEITLRRSTEGSGKAGIQSSLLLRGQGQFGYLHGFSS